LKDPDLGKLIITTPQLSHEEYRAFNVRIENTTGLRRWIEIDTMPDLTWPNRPCRIIVSTPRIVRLLNQTMRATRTLPVGISRFDYEPPPGCDQLDLSERVREFIHLSNLPSFLREVRDELYGVDNEDPYKTCEKFFCAGLDERYILGYV